MRQFKPRVCKQCKTEYIPRTSLQAVCDLQCALDRAREQRLAKEAEVSRAQDRENRRLARERRESLKTKTDWAREAQAAFNLFIRMRDWGKPCISCGRPHTKDHQRHASHYRSVKAAKQHRFNCWQVASSCQQCNTYESGNIVEYRIGLINRIGEDRVLRIERDNRLAKHDIEYYKRIKKIFSKRARLYKKIKGIA